MRPRHTDIGSSRAPLAAAFLAALLIGGCTKDSSSHRYIARVGPVGLTEAELAGAGDSLGIPRGRSRAFVDEWIVAELLYQEAQRRGLTESGSFKQQMESARKRFAINELLERDVYGGEGATVSDDSVSLFFRSNTLLFVLKEDVVRASYALFAERDAANQFRTRLLRGSVWDDALRPFLSDSTNDRRLRAQAHDQYFTQATLYPAELWKLTRTLGKDEVSFVVTTNSGYYVLVVHGIKRSGEPPEFDYVKDDVRERLLIEQRRVRFEKLVADLRSRQRVEITLGVEDSLPAHTE